MTNVCFSLPNITLDGSGPVTALLKLTAGCDNTTKTARLEHPKRQDSSGGGVLGGTSVALAGALLGFIGRKRKWRHSMLLLVALVGMTGLTIGCGGGSSHQTRKGSYTVSVTATDTTTQSVKSVVTVDVTVN